MTEETGLLEALRGRFGTPDTFEQGADSVRAFWRRAGADVLFIRVGASSLLSSSRRS